MNTYITLLRGINVGGHKKVPMAILRELLSKAGFINVKTYIQSGNIVFQSLENQTKKIEKEIQQLIDVHFGFSVSIIVKTKLELQTIFDNCVFSNEKKIKSYFILLDSIPNAEYVKEVEAISFENEEFSIINNCLYFYSSTGYGRTKFNMATFEKKLKVNATSRNYNTINKLLQLA
ncbi:DUF1697 domain-containing protein [Lacinutrix venerupis]|uniref:DUF1697 domain-containing protein n=1 Tax=Lacinutrix venerupis TaxID=1486034 RepID=A0AAC9PY68_9FLAO|nr:DUF1697 domain-containing protein [Lacinutrix venerupis]APY01344.1 hypothetical protein BWR22_13865 [Lacinutrix venerupis]